MRSFQTIPKSIFFSLVILLTIAVWCLMCLRFLLAQSNWSIRMSSLCLDLAPYGSVWHKSLSFLPYSLQGGAGLHHEGELYQNPAGLAGLATGWSLLPSRAPQQPPLEIDELLSHEEFSGDFFQKIWLICWQICLLSCLLPFFHPPHFFSKYLLMRVLFVSQRHPVPFPALCLSLSWCVWRKAGVSWWRNGWTSIFSFTLTLPCSYAFHTSDFN